MKIWNAYGSEHSMNLVMVGSFDSIDDATEAKKFIDDLKEELDGKIDFGKSDGRFSEEVRDILWQRECHNLQPNELEQLHSDVSLSLDGNKVVLKTDESDVSAFLKLLLEKGAKLEVYSAHDYPNEKYGRGK